MFNGIARVEQRLARFIPSTSEVEVLRDIAYGDHPVAHRLDIHRPRFGPRPLPVLLYIHGGAFVLCSKDTHRSIAQINAERAGYLVVTINYRLAPQHPFPAAIADACAAYRWTVRNIARYGGDPGRIMVAGESAGGNLALGVALAGSYRRPETYAQEVFDLGVQPIGVMPLMPYLQVTNPARHATHPQTGYFTRSVARDIAIAYLGSQAPESDATLMADPVRVLEAAAPDRPFPPVFTGAGTADICCGDAQRLEAICRQWNIPVTVSYIENQPHAFHAIHWRAPAVVFWGDIVRFMKDSLIRIKARQPAIELTLLQRTRRWLQARLRPLLPPGREAA
jgi:acetyl esterase